MVLCFLVFLDYRIITHLFFLLTIHIESLMFYLYLFWLLWRLHFLKTWKQFRDFFLIFSLYVIYVWRLAIFCQVWHFSSLPCWSYDLLTIETEINSHYLLFYFRWQASALLLYVLLLLFLFLSSSIQNGVFIHFFAIEL